MPSFGVSTVSPKKSSSCNIFPTSAIMFIRCLNHHVMRNNIRYKANINNMSVIIFLMDLSYFSPFIFMGLNKNSQQWYLLGRTSSEVFVMLVVVLYSLLFLWRWLLFFIHCFSTSSLTLSWVIARVFTPILYFQPGSLQSDSQHFHSFTVLARGLQFWCGIFYPWACFTLRFFPTFLTQPAFFKASLGAGSSFLKFSGLLILETKTASSLCLIHSKPQSWYSEEFVFKRTKYYHKLLVVKSLVICSLFVSNSFRLFKVICKNYKKHFEQDLIKSTA